MSADRPPSATGIDERVAGEGEFAIALGGPFYDAHVRAGLIRPASLHPAVRAMLYVGIAWLPPLLLSLMAGTAVTVGENGAGIGFLRDFRPWAAYVVALPLFVLMEPTAQQRLSLLLGQFARAEIVPPERVNRLREHVAEAVGLRNSWLAEAVMAVLAYVLNAWAMVATVQRYGSSWLGTKTAAGGVHFSMAGWWVIAVSGALFTFLLLRWVWRYLVWANLLRHIARLDLRIAADHPDRMGGLAFISRSPSVFSLFVFAISSVVAATIAKGVVYAGAPVGGFKYVAAAWVLALVVIYTLPLTAFSAPLKAAQQRAVLSYGALASRKTYADQAHWLGGSDPAARGTDSLAGADAGATEAAPGEIEAPKDLKARLDAARGMRTLLLSKEAVLPIALAAVVPMLVVAATQVPARNVLKILKFFIL